MNGFSLLKRTTSLQGKDALSKFLEVTSFGSEIWVKASWDLPFDLKPNWWKTRTDESGEVVAVNYVFQLEGNALTQFKWGGRDEDGATIWQAYKSIRDGFSHLLNLSDLGATIYFYPNKPLGGISNKHVKETNLLFYEIDHLSLGEQWQSVSRFTQSTGLHPSAIIFTGGKSLHVYFQLSKSIGKDDWLKLNRKLTIIQDGDPAICNAARAMRLPGMVRRKNLDEKPTSVSLDQWSESAYSPEEFEQALDSSGLFAYGLSDERWRQWRNATLKARRGGNINPIGILLSPEADLNPKLSYTISTTASVDPNIEFPLEICLTRDDRELIANGIPQGSRDDTGYKLAANIVATANRLNELGYRFSGNPEQLFDEYCTRCSPPLAVRDRNRIWRQAERSATKAALDDSCLENCIRAWQYKNSVQNQPTETRSDIQLTSLALSELPTRKTSESKSVNQKRYIKPIKELPKVGFHIIRRKQSELLERFDALQTKRGQEWLKLRQFTPDKVINLKYFDYDFKPGEDLAIKAGLGGGKSHFTNAKWLANPDEGAASGGYRNCLNEQFCAKGKELNGRSWYQIQSDLKNTESMALIADPESRIAGAVDSWIYFAPHHFDGKKVIFDEVESVAKHLNQSDTAVSFYRDVIKQRVSDALTNSKANLIADGNLRDFTVEYLEKLSGGRKFTKILNQYTGNRGGVYLYNGSCRKRQATEEDVKLQLASIVGEWISFDYKPDDYSKLHRVMMELPTDIPLLILSDSQKKCEAWDRELTAIGRKVFRLDSTSSGTDLGKLFLQNPREFILSEKIDAVILSPSAESGVSIELADELNRQIPGYFKYEFSYFFGISVTDVQTQFLGRNRDPYTTKFCYVQSHSLANTRQITESQDSSDVFNGWIEMMKDCASLSLEGIEEGEILKLALEKIKEQLLNPHIQYESKLLLKESFERTYPRLCLEYALREAGYEVVVIESREDDLSDLKAAQEEIALEKATAIFKSEQITSTEADQLSRKLNKTPEERHQITKSKLLGRLPGLEQKVVIEQKKISSPEQLQRIEESEKVVSVSNTPYEEWKASSQPIPEKGLEVVVEKSAFNPEFVNKVLDKDRYFISRLEGQFLLKNPEVCKLIQQHKWHKKLDLLTDPDKVNFGGLPVARYRSRWLEIHTLLEMGISFFLDPSNSWSDETPEALSFWERGKIPRTARNIGVSHEDDPCRYIGKVLQKYSLRTQEKRKQKPDGTRYREYSIKPIDSLSQAVYECVEQRINSQVNDFIFDWKKIIKNSTFSELESLDTTELQRVHMAPDNLIKIRGDVDVTLETKASGLLQNTLVCDESQKVIREPSILEELAQAFQSCESFTDFVAVVEGFGATPEQVEDALLYQPTRHRQQLRQWWEHGPDNTALAVPLLREAIAKRVKSEAQIAFAPSPTEIGSGEKLENPALELVQSLSRCCNIPSFRQLTHGCSDEAIRAAVGQLGSRDRERVTRYWQEVKRRENPTTERCQVEDGKQFAPKVSIAVNSVVRFTNPGKLKAAQIFEGICLRVKEIFEPLALAYCVLPDGRLESFGLSTLELAT